MTMMYLSAAYSLVQDKDLHMKKIASYIGEQLAFKPHRHIVTPLFNHFVIANSNVRIDMTWRQWQFYSTDLLRRCDGLIVFGDIGGDWETSTGVQKEIELAQALHLPIEYQFERRI